MIYREVAVRVTGHVTVGQSVYVSVTVTLQAYYFV